MKLKESGMTAASKVLNEIAISPGRALKYRKAYKENLKEKKEKLSITQALSVFIEAGQSRKQYEIIA